MAISGIYEIKNTIDGKVYIGRSLDIAKRLKDHERALRKGYHRNKFL